jgi:hypothetical protein
VEKGERHHLEKKIVEMEVVSNLCANRLVMHEDHARRSQCAYGEAL